MLKVPSLQIQTRYSAPDAFAFCIKYPIWPWLTLTRVLVKPVPEQLFLDPASSFLNIRVWIKYFNQAFFYTTEKERERESETEVDLANRKQHVKNNQTNAATPPVVGHRLPKLFS